LRFSQLTKSASSCREFRPFAKESFAFRLEGERQQEFVDVVLRGGAKHGGCVVASLVEGTRERQLVGGDGVNVGERIRARGGLDRPEGRLLELAKAHERHSARGEHAKQHRIVGT
jgi:hypothetical protein